MLCSDFSMRLMISRSTVSGEAPGYGMLTTMTGCSTSGIWLTRSFFSASRPRHISAMIDHDRRDRPLDAEVGEEHGASFGSAATGAGDAAGAAAPAARPSGHPSACESGSAAPCRRRRGRASTAKSPLRASRSPSVQRHLLQLVVLHAPGEGLVAVAHHARLPAASARACCRPRCGLRRTGRPRAAARRRSKATSTSTWRVVGLAAGFTRLTVPANSWSA